MEELLTTKEVARLLRVNEKKVYQLIKEAGLPHVRIAGKWLFPKEHLNHWLRERIQTEKDLRLGGSDDPLLLKFLSSFNRKDPLQRTVFYAAIGSRLGLMALKEAKVEGCCCHLLDPETQEYNLPFLKKWFQAGTYVVVTLWHRRQGLYLAKGNPLGIKDLKDAVSKGARFINRNKGSGTRHLLDLILEQENISSEEVVGFRQEVSTHFEVALKVFLGEADAGLGIEYMAHLFGLEFIPLVEERFDLVFSSLVWETEKVKNFLSFLFSANWHKVPGYSFRDTGKILV
ncbi:helix-turn-helix transcriptional regulator [Thermosulfurimonas dismutans]|uniref:Molybdopterin biosynthesis protein MoeA n=1 Tax=Thermosulfurimonas dismutans TaxID=999894 RepID=A0A179D205_9BACT|nr:helix-turn-helix transcriptional regulator [Thermosulfurimonas dismutans]OAQ20097.1 Molybdopterin biosynthesis protein MoeA [Thermosulfurimonas dismutans]